jgi:probable F420-dependent oxidoreductase
MKIWFIAPWLPAEEMVELARHADALGFEGMMGADHGFIPQSMAYSYPYTQDGKPPISGDMPYPDIWTTIAAMAAATTTLKFSTAVYVLPLRHPIEVAKSLGTLARLSDNRVILGAGAGWMKEEFDVYGVDFKTRGKRMDEMIDVMRALWAGGYVEYHGEFFDFPPLQLAPAPDRNIPVYMGGTNKLALRRAARLGQGWIGAGNDIDEVPALLQTLEDLRCEYGRENEAFETVIAVNQLDQVEKLAELQEQGMTSTVFGFRDYRLPLADKLQQMDAFIKTFSLG